MSKVRFHTGVAAGSVEAPCARLLPALAVVGLMLLGTSCATQMRVQSDPPGAEVTYQRQSYGPTPTTVPIEPGAYGSQVELTLDNGTTKQRVRVLRQETDWKALATWAAVDTAVCCACASTSIVFAPALFAGPTAYLALPAQFWFLGVTVPASVDVDMETGETDQRIADRRDLAASDHEQVVFASETSHTGTLKSNDAVDAAKQIESGESPVVGAFLQDCPARLKGAVPTERPAASD